MPGDIFDRITASLLVAAVATLAALFVVGGSGEGTGGRNRPDKGLEREMAQQARVEMVSKLYAPVENLRREGKRQEALLKLDELQRKYPGEAHGYILQGLIQQEVGALDEAVVSFVAGVKLNGEYVDRKSGLSRRQEIESLVNGQLKRLAERGAASPGNRSVAVALQNVNYLKSRLAGGCE